MFIENVWLDWGSSSSSSTDISLSSKKWKKSSLLGMSITSINSSSSSRSKNKSSPLNWIFHFIWSSFFLPFLTAKSVEGETRNKGKDDDQVGKLGTAKERGRERGWTNKKKKNATCPQAVSSWVLISQIAHQGQCSTYKVAAPGTVEAIKQKKSGYSTKCMPACILPLLLLLLLDSLATAAVGFSLSFSFCKAG